MEELFGQDSNSDDEREGSFKEEDDGSHLGEDGSSGAAHDPWMIEDFEIIFKGTVGAFRGRAEFFDGAIEFRAARDFIDDTGMVFKGAMMNISSLVLDMRTRGDIVTAL
ncbi:MAG: hypothetical protein AAB110_01805 [Candidatus Desantisbacteria bacterium]